MIRKRWIVGFGLVGLLGAGALVRAQEQPRREEHEEREEKGEREEKPATRPTTRVTTVTTLDRIKTTLGISDEQWKDLRPKVMKVLQAQRSASRTPPAIRTGQNLPENATPVKDALERVHDVAGFQDANAEELQGAVAGYRAAVKKAEERVRAAQQELKTFVGSDIRLEAGLVNLGVLE